LRSVKSKYLILFVRWSKIIEFYLHIQICYQQSWPHFSWATLYNMNAFLVACSG